MFLFDFVDVSFVGELGFQLQINESLFCYIKFNNVIQDCERSGGCGGGGYIFVLYFIIYNDIEILSNI